MSAEFLPSLFSHVWTITLVVLFFGGSIFVHELGHFLAARWRGLKVEVFSIGMGPKLCSFRGKDGVEYRLSWFPVGGYVRLPQLADMSAIEGAPEGKAAELPPVSYRSRVIVFAAGAAFNFAFAFLLACIIWRVGEPQSSQVATTKIGYIPANLEKADGSKIPGPVPAVEAGLRIGDTILAVDGESVGDWNAMRTVLVTGSGRDSDGSPRVVFTIERDGKPMDVVLHPRLAGDENLRAVGILPDYDLVVAEVPSDSIGAKAGFRQDDIVVDLDGVPVRNLATYQNYLVDKHDQAVKTHVTRAGKTVELEVPPRPNSVTRPGLGITFSSGLITVYPTPIKQIGEVIDMTFRSLRSLLNPHSDIGASKMTGPIGIVRAFYDTAEASMRGVLVFTILININLAILNLLPIPVLDGGHILFATVSRLRGRALPMNFVMSAQSVFVVLLFSMILYVTFNDVVRIYSDSKSQAAAAAVESGK